MDGVMLFKGLGTSRMWWDTPDPSEALGMPGSSIRNPGFLGQRESLWMSCPHAGFLIHAGRGFSLPNVVRLMKSPGCLDDMKQTEMWHGLSQDLGWDVPGSSQGWWEESPGCGTTPL